MTDVGVGDAVLAAGPLFAGGGVIDAGPTPWKRGLGELRRLHDWSERGLPWLT